MENRQIRRWITWVGTSFLAILISGKWAYIAYTDWERERRMVEIEQMDSCEKAKIQFDKDLEGKKVKYFLFGMMPNEEYAAELRERYGFEIFYMGCIVTESLTCYNRLVNEYFGEGKKERIYWQ